MSTTTNLPIDRLERVESDLAILQSVVASGLPAEKPEDREYSGSVGLWVDRWLLPRIERQLTIGDAGVRWCSRWREHPEAYVRLEALRDAWTEARLGPGSAMASWWIEKVDPTLRTLFASDGPFARCRETHRHLPSLPSEQMPESGSEAH
jgi:hypothetical protein